MNLAIFRKCRFSRGGRVANAPYSIVRLDIPRESTVALFRILRSALDPNLIFDTERTQDRVIAAQEAVQAVEIEVAEGQTIIEPNSKVTALQYEQLESYRKALRLSESG
jgi:membrane-associated HD superfamily phosphohydrolase